MARIRTVKPEFWQDEDLASVSESANLLAIGLLNFSDDEGYFKANELLIKAAVFPLRNPSTSIRRSIDELSSIGYIQLSSSASDNKEYGRVVKFDEHQRVDRKKASKIKDIAVFGCNSTINRRSIDDQSTQEGKGKEGKGKEGVKTLIPKDFHLSDELIKYAKSKGVEDLKYLEDYTEGFVLQCQTKGYKYVSFNSAWKKWFPDHLKKNQASTVNRIPKDQFV